jgi:DNA-binding winged helix-turn-helix (wHTH) protein/tetratricopeptide (TPR) repeat protein
MAFTLQELQAGFRIGDCLIEPRQNRIVRGEAEAHVEPRVMDVLVCLAQRAGEVVSRETLNQQVWGNVVVTDQAVTNCISELRHHLGDDRAANRIIETIPKRGYRLTAPVLTAPVQLVGAESQQGELQQGRLQQDRLQQDLSQQAASPPPAGSQQHESRPRHLRPARRWLFAASSLLLAAVLIGFAWWWRSASTSGLTSVAVVQFENAAGDETLDYLGLALPDEIATLLTKSRDLAVRPIATVDASDPLAAARARGVDHIVTGRYYLEENNLSLAVEAQHVSQERVIWRTRVTAPAGDLLAMRGRIAESVQQGLMPALGASADPASGFTPAHAEAYQLYLRSLALPKQPKPIERAIEMLEQAVTLEPQFAVAWEALGVRYYDHGTYGVGAEPARQQAIVALRKALELDPQLTFAARQMVALHAESGDLERAYREARQLLGRSGASAPAHFSLAFVYRFGGLLEASQRHCELALDRDPHDPRLRSCAYSYLYAGELPRVMDYLMLDEGSYFVQWGTVLYNLRLDNRDAALHVARQAADEPTRRLMEPCLEGTRGAALDTAVAEFLVYWQRHSDPETAYAVAPMLSYCGRPQDAMRFVERAVDSNFCSYPALDQDPIWAALRSEPEFQRIRTKAMACHERFRRMVESVDKGSRAAQQRRALGPPA